MDRPRPDPASLHPAEARGLTPFSNFCVGNTGPVIFDRDFQTSIIRECGEPPHVDRVHCRIIHKITNHVSDRAIAAKAKSGSPSTSIIQRLYRFDKSAQSRASALMMSSTSQDRPMACPRAAARARRKMKVDLRDMASVWR